jgi:hypothetical protein
MRPYLGIHTISHETLGLRTNHPVLFRKKEPRRFRLPCGIRGFLLNAFHRYGPLNCSDNRCVILRNLVSDRSAETLFWHPDNAVLIGCEVRSVRMWFSTVKHIRNRLSFVGRQGCNEYKGLYAIIMLRGDHRTAIGVSGHYEWPSCSFDYALESRYVLRERRKGDGGARNLKPLPPQRQNDIVPA